MGHGVQRRDGGRVKKLILSFLMIASLSCSKAERRVASVESASPAVDVQQVRSGAVTAAGSGSRTVLPFASTAEGDSAAPKMPRMIVRTAEMRITVADTGKAVDSVTKAVESMGGFVSDSNVWREGELLRATVKLRVPADKLTTTLASIRGLAKRVDHETIASEDVSQEFVDLDSQVRNLEATEAELLELLVVARKNSRKASEVLEVHEQLMSIRGQIEQARGRMRYLSQVAAMSSVTLHVIPDAIAQPVVEAGWEPLIIARNAVRALVSALQVIGTAAIWLVLYLLPILAIVGFFLFLLWRLVRRSRPREA